jgi:hypothetical protein
MKAHEKATEKKFIVLPNKQTVSRKKDEQKKNLKY